MTGPHVVPAHAHASSSHEQRAAETVMLDLAGPLLGGATLRPTRIDLGGGRHVMVDGLSLDPLVVVEAYARRGATSGAQPRKDACDVLKLVTVQRLVHPRARLAIVLNDPVVAAQISGGWLGTAAQQWEVEILVVDLPVHVNAGISAAQARQTR